MKMDRVCYFCQCGTTNADYDIHILKPVDIQYNPQRGGTARFRQIGLWEASACNGCASREYLKSWRPIFVLLAFVTLGTIALPILNTTTRNAAGGNPILAITVISNTIAILFLCLSLGSSSGIFFRKRETISRILQNGMVSAIETLYNTKVRVDTDTVSLEYGILQLVSHEQLKAFTIVKDLE